MGRRRSLGKTSKTQTESNDKILDLNPEDGEGRGYVGEQVTKNGVGKKHGAARRTQAAPAPARWMSAGQGTRNSTRVMRLRKFWDNPRLGRRRTIKIRALKCKIERALETLAIHYVRSADILLPLVNSLP